jgi:hypothetical protein
VVVVAVVMPLEVPVEEVEEVHRRLVKADLVEVVVVLAVMRRAVVAGLAVEVVVWDIL